MRALNGLRPEKILAAVLLLASALPVRASAARVELIYDGNLVRRAEIRKFGGNEYMSVKSAAALFRGSTQWYPLAGKVVLRLNNRRIAFSAGSRVAAIGGRKVRLDAPARLVRGTLFVPVGFFASSAFEEAAECGVTWDPESRVLDAEPRVTLYPPRVYSRPSLTRVVLESTQDFSPEVRKSGRSVLIEIPKARIGDGQRIKVNDGAVKAVKFSREGRGAVVRVDLAGGATSYSWTREKEPYRLVLAVRNPKAPKGAEEEEEPETVTGLETAVSAGAPAEKPARHKYALKSPEAGPGRVRRIVVDAGHGGKDAGAIGPSGTKEKDINLLIALELARVLRVEGEYDVLLTRSSDTFIPLIDRSQFANQNKADLFISIHCNASVSKSQKGFEVYYLSEKASDPHAEATEQLENSVVALEGPKSAQKERLQELLFSMAQNEFINQSSLLCSSIEKSVDRRVSEPDRGIKQANFHVLHGSQMPSVLVETAFITNPVEETRLRQRRFRSAVVDAVFTAVQDYAKKVQLLYGKR